MVDEDTRLFVLVEITFIKCEIDWVFRDEPIFVALIKFASYKVQWMRFMASTINFLEKYISKLVHSKFIMACLNLLKI